MNPLIPDFEVGWCNGWIGTIPIILSMIILFILNKGATNRAINMSTYNVKEKCQTFLSTFVFFGAVLYSIGLPLRLETMWFYIGSALYASGSIPYVVATFNFASAPQNELIVKGVYKISRNPMYFFSAITLLGIGIACASYFMVILVILYIAITHLTVLAEEKYCSEKYGETYQKYMKAVPRYFLFF